MTFIGSKRNIEDNPIRNLLFNFIIVFAFAIGISLIIFRLWAQYLVIYHSILETVCVFIAFSIFFCIWHIFDWSSTNTTILGFGYLSVAIYDLLHTIYFLKLDLSAESYFDLSTRYWILARLTEAVTMSLAIRATGTKGNKRTRLFNTLIITIAIAYFVFVHHDYLPVLLTEEGLTPLKVILEYLVISIYVYTLYKARNKLKDKDFITYKYVFIAVLLSLFSELCFTMYISIQSLIWTLGHVIKMAAYFYIYKGIIISCITFSYRRLEIERDNLEATNKELNELTENLNDIMDALPIAIQTYDEKGRVKYINKKYEELLKCIRTYRNLEGDTVKLSLKSRKIRNGVLLLINDANEEQKFDNLHIQTETILNAVNSGIMMIDNDRKVVLCNQAIADILEISKNEITGKCIDNIKTFIKPNTKESEYGYIDEGEARKSYESSFVTPSGVRKELMTHISPVRDLYGEVIGQVIVSNDITESNKRQKQILQQEKLALLGQMGAAIVHETRNYLTNIKGRCQLIELYTDNEKVRAHAAKIDDDIDEVNRIISEFLFLSKPRDTELVETSMHDIFEAIKSMITTGSLVKGVDVEFNLCKEERYLLCDESQIKQIILNLCKNAIEAMADKSERKLIIETGYIEETNEMYISVKDNGIGISEENIKKIGTPFFTTKGNGTGLGISVCHKIAKEHNGRLEVKSKLGEGTTFTLLIPCIEDEKIVEAVQ